MILNLEKIADHSCLSKYYARKQTSYHNRFYYNWTQVIWVHTETIIKTASQWYNLKAFLLVLGRIVSPRLRSVMGLKLYIERISLINEA